MRRRERSTLLWTENRALLLFLLRFFSLILLSASVTAFSLRGDGGALLLISAIPVLSFLIPTLFYLRSEDGERLDWLGASPTLPMFGRTLLLSLALFLFGVFGVTLLGEIFALPVSLYGFLSVLPDFSFGALMAYAVIPALCEVVPIFGITGACCGKRSITYTVLISSVLYGVCSFSLSALPLFLLAGAAIALVHRATRSFIAPLMALLAFRVGGYLAASGSLLQLLQPLWLCILSGVFAFGIFLAVLPYHRLPFKGEEEGEERVAASFVAFEPIACILLLVLFTAYALLADAFIF